MCVYPSPSIILFKAGLQTLSPKMVLFFASSTYPSEETAREMGAAFPGSSVFGCTTAGEIISGHMLKNSIVAMASNAAVIEDVQVEVLIEARRRYIGLQKSCFHRC